MITEVVHFSLPVGISRDEVLSKYRQTAPAWSMNEDLVQKFYFFDAQKSVGGGVYVWKTLEAAQRWHGDEYKARIRELYGSDVHITCYDTLVVVDNVAKRVYEPIAAS